MNKFLERFVLPKRIQKETENLSRHNSIKGIEFIIENLTEKMPDPVDFTGEIFMSVLSKVSQKTEETLSNSFL